MGITTNCYQYPIRSQSDGMLKTSVNSNDVFPLLNIALTILIISGSHNGAISTQTHDMITSSADRDDIGPVAYLHICPIAFACGDYGSV